MQMGGCVAKEWSFASYLVFLKEGKKLPGILKPSIGIDDESVIRSKAKRNAIVFVLRSVS